MERLEVEGRESDPSSPRLRRDKRGGEVAGADGAVEGQKVEGQKVGRRGWIGFQRRGAEVRRGGESEFELVAVVVAM